MTQNNKIHLEFFILGLFLVAFATNAYLLLGNFGKFFSLITGSSLLGISVIRFGRGIDKKKFIVFSSSLLLLTFYIIHSFLMKQETFTVNIIIFDLVNLFLFFVGYHIGGIRNQNLELKPYIFILILVLILLSTLKYYLFQKSLNPSIEGARNIADDLNPVGVAYTNSIILWTIIWLLKCNKKLSSRILLIPSLIGTLLIIFFTESRGALVYSILISIAISGFSLLNIFKIKYIVPVILTFLVLQNFQVNEVFQNKSISLMDRFNILSGGSIQDRSIQERIELQMDFYQNYDQMIFGKFKYTPYPHNQFIEIFMRFGILGIPLIFLSFKTLINSVRFYFNGIRKRNSIQTLMFLIFMFCYLQSMTSLNLDNNRILWLGFGVFLNSQVLIKE